MEGKPFFVVLRTLGTLASPFYSGLIEPHCGFPVPTACLSLALDFRQAFREGKGNCVNNLGGGVNRDCDGHALILFRF